MGCRVQNPGRKTIHHRAHRGFNIFENRNPKQINFTIQNQGKQLKSKILIQ